MIDRKREISVENMQDEELQNLQKSLSVKINEIVQEAIEKSNKYLNIYGMEALMQIEIKDIKKTNNL